jgi:osmotically-inducible protein OsmY
MKNGIRVLLAATLLTAAPAMTGCSREPDVRDQLSSSLEQAKIDNVNVDWDTDAKVAHLKGEVKTSADRQKAEEIATAVVGTSGTVLNELTVEGMNEEAADDQDGVIRERLFQLVEDDPMLKQRNVNFDVNNGVVTVTGEVTSEAEKEKVSQLVKSAPGVKEFANSLQVKAAS